MAHCVALRHYAVIAVIFHYYAVSMHDMGNCSIGKSATKSNVIFCFLLCFMLIQPSGCHIQ